MLSLSPLLLSGSSLSVFFLLLFYPFLWFFLSLCLHFSLSSDFCFLRTPFFSPLPRSHCSPLFSHLSSLIFLLPSSPGSPLSSLPLPASVIICLCRIVVIPIVADVVVQSLSHVCLFATPWTATCQASLSFTISQSLLKLMSIESMMPSNHLILCCLLLLLPLIFPSIRVFSDESALCLRWPNIRTSALASVPPMNTQGWFPLGLTDLISLLSKGLSRVFFSTKIRKHKWDNSN